MSEQSTASKTAARSGRRTEPKAEATDGVRAGAAASSAAADAQAAKQPRFHFFLIDSGWNSAAARVIRDNLDMITRFQNDDPLFVLSQEQSTALIRRHPHFIGKDPILLARDLEARGSCGDTEYHGFHLNMGLVKDPIVAVDGLRKFLHFLAIHRKSANIEQDVKQQLHRAGLQGAIEVLRLSGEAMVG